MAIVINGSGTITGVSAGGLPDDSVDAGMMAANSIDSDSYVDASIDNAHLADDAVGVAELSATGTASSSTFLRGDNAWAAAGGGKVLGYTFISSGGVTSSGTGTTKVSVCSGSYTPQSGSSKILAIANCQIDARTGVASDNIRWAVFRDSTSFNEHWLIYGESGGANQIASLGSTFDLGDGHDADTAYTFYLKLGCESAGDTFRVHERSSMLLLELEV